MNIIGWLIAIVLVALLAAGLIWAIRREKSKWRDLNDEELRRILDFADGQTWPPTDIH